MRATKGSGSVAVALMALLAGCESTGPSAPPAPPGTLAAVPASNRKVTLAWTLRDDGIDALELERAQDSGPFAVLATLEGAATSYTDDGLTPGTAYRYRVRACNRSGCSEFGPEVSVTTFGTLTLTTTSLPSGVIGLAYQATLATTGGNAPLTFSLGGGEVPAGVTLAASGELRGTPSAAGTYQFIVRVASADGQTESREFALLVRGVLTITTSTLPNAVVGRNYAAAIAAIGGDSVYTWFVEAGTVPAGLSLSDRGIVSGIPDTEQVAHFTARVRSGDGQTAVRDLSITVAASTPTATVSVRTTLLPPGIQGLVYNPRLRAQVSNSSPVSWSLLSGTLPPGVVLAANGGLFGTPSQTGSFTFTVRATAGGATADGAFTVRIDPNDESRFNITRFDVAPVPASIAPHVAQAIARWESVIVGELTADSVQRDFFGGSSCGGFGDEANGTAIEDVIVMVNVAPIDGEGSVLAQAGPCAFREDDDLTGIGILTLDSRDLVSLAGTQTLTDIVFHEIGHVLGFGTLWEGFGCTPGTTQCRNYLTGAGGDDPAFGGTLAVQEWSALGGTGSVPVENSGGSGTRDSHWRETTFDSEIMTGFIERSGLRNPLSRVTIASMADLGYRVSYASADGYTLPAGSSLRLAPALVEGGWEMPLPDPPVPLSRR